MGSEAGVEVFGPGAFDLGGLGEHCARDFEATMS
jgi:hypothetical protein